MNSLADYPKLELSPEDLAALRTQGSVAAEWRRGQILYKLRFRRDGVQQVRVLGRNRQRAADIQAALQAWQARWKFQRQTRRELRSLAAEGRALRRSIKSRLAEHLAQAGFQLKLHGRQLRRPRRRQRDSPETQSIS